MALVWGSYDLSKKLFILSKQLVSTRCPKMLSILSTKDAKTDSKFRDIGIEEIFILLQIF